MIEPRYSRGKDGFCSDRRIRQVVTSQATHYRSTVISSFRHRALKALYEGRTARRVAPEHVPKLMDILAALDRSDGPEGMDLPGFRLHALSGPMKGYFAVTVSANWRVTFRFEDGSAIDVDYVDYH